MYIDVRVHNMQNTVVILVLLKLWSVCFITSSFPFFSMLTLKHSAQMRGGELSMCYEAIAARYASIAVCFPLVVMNSVPRHAPDQDDEEELLPSRPVELCCIRNIPAVKVMA